MLLSIIIPAYNIANYISKCIDSILAQGLNPEQYEIIVIDDGSQDNVAEIVMHYCENNPNIRLIRQENKGLSASRNVGLQNAKGEYIHFVDGDDYMVANSYYHIFNNLLNWSREYDIIKFHSTTVDKTNNQSINQYDNVAQSRIIFTGNHSEQILQNGNFSIFAWSLIIRRSVLIDNNIFFKVGTSPAEDVVFNVNLAKIPDLKVMVCNTNTYRYVVRENSIVTSRTNVNIKRNLDALEKVFNELKTKSSPPFLPMYSKLLVGISRQIATRSLSLKMTYSETRARLKKYKKNGFLPIQDTSKSNRIINLLIKNSVAFYIANILYRKIFLPYFKQFVPRN